MTTVWFIRHGQSEANAGLPSDDPHSIPLTPMGLVQAHQLADRWVEAPKLLVTSPYLRAQKTAQPTADRFSQVPLEIWPVQEFTYLSARKQHDTTAEERLPAVQAYWNRCDPEYEDGDGAESFGAFWDRVGAALAQLKIERREPVVVFTHGQWMQSVLFRFLTGHEHATPEVMRKYRAFCQSVMVPNTARLEWQIERGRVRSGPLRTDHLTPGLLTY